MNHNFQSSTNPNRNHYVGSWQETGWSEIALPFNASNLSTLLDQAAGNLSAEFTHQDIAHWCERYSMAARMGEFRQSSAPTERMVASIAEDVSAQWDLFLANTYSLSQLQALNFSEIRLPAEWFRDWLQRTQELHLNNNA